MESLPWGLTARMCHVVVSGSRTTCFMLNLNQNPWGMRLRRAVQSVQADFIHQPATRCNPFPSSMAYAWGDLTGSSLILSQPSGSVGG